MNLKIPNTIFLFIPLFQILIKHTYKSQNTWHSFLLIPFFQILKKAYLRISKPLTQFFAHILFQILKEHTYKSQNTWHSFLLIPLSNVKKSIFTNLKTPLVIIIIIIIIILKETIYIKTIIQIDKHKVKYIITACIPIIIIEKFLLFFFTVY